MNRALFLAIALLAGCGNWSDEDAEFQAAVPSREDLTLSPPAQQALALQGLLGTQRQALGQSEVYTNVVATADDVNAFVALLTSGLDFVLRLPPTEREPNRRVWGPYADRERPGFDVRIAMSRDEAGDFGYQLQWRPHGGEYVAPISGSFQGARASDGTGSFLASGDRMRELGFDDGGMASLGLAYDMRGEETRATLNLSGRAGTDVAIAYRVRPQGAGWMRYEVLLNLPATATSDRERLSVRTEWLADKSGRNEVRVTGGDLGVLEGTYDECWDAAFAQVWRAQTFDCGGAQPACEEGDSAACSLDSVSVD